MSEEIWENCYFTNEYQVSNLGKVRSTDRKVKSKNGYRFSVGKVLKPVLNPNGYQRVWIKGETYDIHRLVAYTFYGVPQKKCHVNHKDHNKLNNKLENLEIVTASQNHNHAKLAGKTKTKFWHLEARHVRSLKNLEFYFKFTQAELAQIFMTKRSTVFNIVHRRSWVIDE